MQDGARPFDLAQGVGAGFGYLPNKDEAGAGEATVTVLIAGGGIAGLTLGLTCHEIGVPFRVFESRDVVRPLGVGINIQPNAARELIAMGLEGALDAIGVRTREYGFYTKHGLEIWVEPRGAAAGPSGKQRRNCRSPRPR